MMGDFERGGGRDIGNVCGGGGFDSGERGRTGSKAIRLELDDGNKMPMGADQSISSLEKS